MDFLKCGLCLYSLIFVIHVTKSSPINELTKGISEFSSDLYLECVKSKPGNVIVSPLSIANALALLTQATSGRTFEELNRGLHLNIDKAAAADKFLEHRDLLKKNAGNSTLSIANRIYVQQGQRLNKNFEDVSTSKFKSGIESINFADSEKSARKINHFVEVETNGKIKDLISSDMLDSDTRSVLVNAVYFKGNWETPFVKDFTYKEEFYLSETDKFPVDFMHMDSRFRYAYIEDLDASAIEMKYANSNMSFVIVLPEKRTGLQEMETKLKNYDLNQITDKMQARRLEVHIPKFKVEYDINLKNVLENLGMKTMFSESDGLKGILESGESLKVSDVIHKTVIEVEEKGTEAAAGSASLIVAYSLPPQFSANHPFMYYIRETESNTIIFSGRIVNF